MRHTNTKLNLVIVIINPSLHETTTTASVACVSRLFVRVAASYSGLDLWAD
jgi:hypothetical protein